MRLSAKLSLLVVFLLGGLIIMGFFGIYQMSRINDTSTELSENWLPGTNAVNQLNTLVSDVRINEVSHVFNEDSSLLRTYEQNIQTLLGQMNKITASYNNMRKEPEEARIYQEFQGLWKQYRTMSEKMLGLSTALKTADAIVLLQGDSDKVYQEINTRLLRLVEINLQGGDAASAHANDMYNNATWLVFVALGLMTILGILGGFVAVRSILKQLGKDPGDLANIAERVTNGDYNIADGSPTTGVYGNIVRMVEALESSIAKAQDESTRAHQESLKAQEAMKTAEAASQQAMTKTNAMLAAADQLEQVVAIVSSASEELSAQINQSEHGAADQAARVTETATAMEEMNSTVLEVAKNASAASDVSTNTRQKAEAGAQVVQHALSRIHKVRTQSMELKNDMEKLNEQAQSISQIMSVISDIADQTNLLALNAAIEAARAGEAGRGFAVVADEVRKLAEKTMASTTDVGNAIRTIQQSAAQNMEQVDNSVTLIEEATDYANQSGTALSEIVSLVDSTADQVRAIATASEQQSASSEEINQSIAQVNIIAGETARAMQEASRAVMELSRQSQVLGGMIERMKE